MYYKRDHCELYFFHIPRTGGRWVQGLLRKNDFKHRLCGNVESSEQPYELLHYPKFLLKRDYPHYDIDNQFTVVRDPVDRFLSGVGYHEISDLFKLSRMSYYEFKGYLEDHMSYNHR